MPYLQTYFSDTTLLKISIVCVILQISLISILIILYFKNLLSRILREYVQERYEYYIMEATLGNVDKDSPLFKTAPFIRKILRVILINRIMSVGGEARKGLVELYRELGFDKIDERLLASRKWYHRLSAITSLTIMKSPILKDKIPEIISNKNISIKIATIKAICSLNLTEFFQEIIKGMETLPDWANERIIPIIMQMEKRPYEYLFNLFNSSSSRIKRHIVPLLFEAHSDQALWDLTKNFNEYDYETQISIAKSLYKISDFSSISAFAEDIMKSDRWELKAQLIKSLGRLKDERTFPILTTGLDDKNWFVRYNSAVALALYGEKGLLLLNRFAQEKAGFKSDISRYILDLSRYGLIEEEL